MTSVIPEAIGWVSPFLVVIVLFVWSDPRARRNRARYRAARRTRRALEAIR